MKHVDEQPLIIDYVDTIRPYGIDTPEHTLKMIAAWQKLKEISAMADANQLKRGSTPPAKQENHQLILTCIKNRTQS